MVDVPYATITDVVEQDKSWRIVYRSDEGATDFMEFSRRGLWGMYETESHRNFLEDYDLGRGLDSIEKVFLGRRISAGKPDSLVFRFEDENREG
jgi:hypothetical protein